MIERDPSAGRVEREEPTEKLARMFENLIDSGAELYPTDLLVAFQRGEITRDQFNKLIAKLIESNQNLVKFREMSGIDVTTGLLDRVHLRPKLEKLIQGLDYTNEKRQSPSQAVMVIALDMNGLKYLNDHYTHAVGDQALVALSDRLRQVLRDAALFRPAGGDEFTAMFSVIREDADFDKLFRRIREDINEGLFIQIKEADGEVTKFPISVSMGYSVMKRGEEKKTADELLREADESERRNKKLLKEKNNK